MIVTESNESSETSVDIFERICGDNVATEAKAKETWREIDHEQNDNVNTFDELYVDDFMHANGVSYLGNIGETSSPVDVTMRTSSKWSSGETLRNKRCTKKRVEKEKIAELLARHIKITEILNRNLEKDNEYSMSQCLEKLGNIPNISTIGILAVQEALKDNNNKSIFMAWEGVVLKAWIDDIVSTHPRYYASSAWR